MTPTALEGSASPRDYRPLLEAIPPGGDVDSIMRRVTDAYWEAFGRRPARAPSANVSWVGFYTRDAENPDQMLLGPRRDKPACSPIGLHGACGRSLLSRRPLVVTDVAHLGEGYIACDPRDRSELVVPLLNPDGSAWAVLDVDSHDTRAFDVFDALAVARWMHHLGLSAGYARSPEDVEVV